MHYYYIQVYMQIKKVWHLPRKNAICNDQNTSLLKQTKNRKPAQFLFPAALTLAPCTIMSVPGEHVRVGSNM